MRLLLMKHWLQKIWGKYPKKSSILQIFKKNEKKTKTT